ncbi:MAG: TatD family hydrolase, partial [Candidatus Kapaibacterium sp.]
MRLSYFSPYQTPKMRPFAKARTMGTTMIDSHCHIDASAFDADRTQVLERAWHAGVEAIVIPSIAPAGFDA